jgi:hypothetical protein
MNAAKAFVLDYVEKNRQALTTLADSKARPEFRP